MGRIIDLTGRRFGLLTVISRNESDKVFPSGQHSPLWKCKCDCGKETIVLGRNLITGNTQSCGCFALASRTKHKLWGSKVYKTWDNMLSRCYNRNIKQYERWWGRGIVVCEEWRTSFDSFYAYVSKLPHFGENGRSFDRINNNGNYEPGNVRWATRYEQTHNRECSKHKSNGVI